jgi:hypothetical protein
MTKLRLALGGSGLLVVSCLLVMAAAATAAAPSVNYRGRTSQRRPISFAVASHAVDYFQYRIDDRCPGGKVLFVRTWGFPAMKIKHNRFGGKFSSKGAQVASAIIDGTVNGKTIKGSISDRTEDPKSHDLCHGKTTFTLKHQ